jgi:hypothetical protein
MKFQLDQTGWPIGQFVVPAGTTLDLGKPESQMTDWEKLARGRAPPMNALALDDEAEQTMQRAHPWNLNMIRRVR